MHIIFDNTNIDKSLYKVVTYKRNEVIFNEGDLCNEVGFVEEGLISIKTNTYLNNEYEINNVGPNGAFGLFLVFSNDTYYFGTAIALKQTKVYVFSKENLLLALTDKFFLLNYLKMHSNASVKVQEKVKVLSQGSIRDRIMFLLISHYKEHKDNVFKFKSKEILANYLCIPRPSLSRELGKLAKDNIITFDRHSIILNTEYINI